MKTRPFTSLLLATLFAFSATGTGAAQFEVRDTPKAVVELFTSQGCSSCPAADKVLADYAERKDVIALAYHVDYWDYIGWADTFGDPAYSDYQRAYAAARGQSRIYTPQLMVNGQTDIVGSREAEIAKAISGAGLSVPVALRREGDVLVVDIGAQPDRPKAIIWLVTFKTRADVKVERGENRGKVLSYSQIVTGRQILGMWSGGDATHLKLPLPEILDGKSDGFAVLVQEEKNKLPGAILGAASFNY